MPYVRCPNCRFSSYSAAHYASVDACPACGEALTRVEPTSDANEWLVKGTMAELDEQARIASRAPPAAAGARDRWAKPSERTRLWETVREQLGQPRRLIPRSGVEDPDG